MSTSLTRELPERVEELHMLAGAMRARLELAGMHAKVWSNHGRLRLYVETSHGPAAVYLFGGQSQVRNGSKPARKQVSSVLSDLLYFFD